jgi:CRISPR type III-A-associated protein Csm2
MIKVCENCKREFEPLDPRHRLCRECFQATRRQGQPPRRTTQAPAGPDTSTSFEFGPDYLAGGYFDKEKGDEQKGEGEKGEEEKGEEKKVEKRYLRPEIVDTLAMDAAKVLGNQGMKSAQMRRFFNKARGIESKLDRVKDFKEVRADIYGFKRDVAYQVGRGVVPEEFKDFIDRNVELAVEDERSFRDGFLQHFESVLAYFVYFFRKQ